MTAQAPATFPITGANGIVQTLAEIANPDGTNTPSTAIEGTRATYSAAFNQTIATGSTSDVISLPGSATKTIRIIRATIMGSTGTPVTVPLALIKRSTANSGGTSAALTIVPRDSQNATATAAPVAYTVAPTPGTAAGTLAMTQLPLKSVNTLVGASAFDILFGDHNDQAIVLRGTAESLGINLLGYTTGTPTLCGALEWIEDNS